MQNKANCPKLGPETPDIYVLYLNGLFVMLHENGFLSFDGWKVLNYYAPVHANKTKLEKVTEMISDAINDAENSNVTIKNAIKNFKSAFHQLEAYIRSL